MKNIFLVAFLILSPYVYGQVNKPEILKKDTTASIFIQTDFQQLWNHQFENTLSFNSLRQHGSFGNLMSCSPNHLPGLFCKMEYKIETKSKLAPRFRLGSLNYTNWMEGKGNYYTRYQ